MLSRVIAKNIGDVFLRQSVHLYSPNNSSVEKQKYKSVPVYTCRVGTVIIFFSFFHLSYSCLFLFYLLVLPYYAVNKDT